MAEAAEALEAVVLTEAVTETEEPPRLLTIRREGAKGDRLLVPRVMVLSFGLVFCVCVCALFRSVDSYIRFCGDTTQTTRVLTDKGIGKRIRLSDCLTVCAAVPPCWEKHDTRIHLADATFFDTTMMAETSQSSSALLSSLSSLLLSCGLIQGHY